MSGGCHQFSLGERDISGEVTVKGGEGWEARGTARKDGNHPRSMGRVLQGNNVYMKC